MENNATEVCPDSNSATLKNENDEEKYCGVKISAFEIPSGATTLKISQSESSRNLISESQKSKRFGETKSSAFSNKKFFNVCFAKRNLSYFQINFEDIMIYNL